MSKGKGGTVPDSGTNERHGPFSESPVRSLDDTQSETDRRRAKLMRGLYLCNTILYYTKLDQTRLFYIKH